MDTIEIINLTTGPHECVSHPDSNTIAVTYYNTSDKSVTINNGDFFTHTTKRRINKYLNVLMLDGKYEVVQSGNKWYVDTPRGRIAYSHNMKLVPQPQEEGLCG